MKTNWFNLLVLFIASFSIPTTIKLFGELQESWHRYGWVERSLGTTMLLVPLIIIGILYLIKYFDKHDPTVGQSTTEE